MLQSMNTSPDPLLVANLQPDGAHSTSTYSKAMQRGQLLRLRRGVYIPTDIWLRSRPSQRYQLMLAAASLQLGSPVFCRESALQIHGLPLLEAPGCCTSAGKLPIDYPDQPAAAADRTTLN